MIPAADLLRLRVPLAALPETFDRRGLWVVRGDFGFGDRGLWTGLDDHKVLDPATGETWMGGGAWAATTEDASTRDRLARWAAERVWPAQDACSTAPGWTHAGAGTWVLTWFGRGVPFRGRPYSHTARMFGSTRAGSQVCPALADLDPDDSRPMPDGSRLVDALALTAVALHLAGR